MQFLILTSSVTFSGEAVQSLTERFLGGITIPVQRTVHQWQSKDGRVLFLGANPDVEQYRRYPTFHADNNGGMAFIHGWIKEYESESLISAQHVAPYLDITEINHALDGQFLVGRINASGIGKLAGSLAGLSCYFCKNGRYQAFSNRLHVLGSIFEGCDVDTNFLAHHLEFTDFYLPEKTAFQGISTVRSPIQAELAPGKFQSRSFSGDMLRHPELGDLYASNQDAYWNQCVRQLKAQAQAFASTGLLEGSQMGITGGKDSRIDAALYGSLVSRNFSWGPPYFSDVAVGCSVAECLGVPHEIANDLDAPEKFSISSKDIAYHIFDREFESTPWDIARRHTDVSYAYINGQEYGLRKYLSGLDLAAFRENRLKGFDHPKRIRPGVMASLREEYARTFDELFDGVGVDSYFEILENYYARGCRWVAKLCESELAHRFAIFPLASNTACYFAYNLPRGEVQAEAFHYHVTKRLDPRLLEVSLAGQVYQQAPRPPIKEALKGDRYPKQILLRQNAVLIRELLQTQSGTTGFMSESFLDGLDFDKMTDFQCQQLFQALQCICHSLPNLDFKLEVDLPSTDVYAAKAIYQTNLDYATRAEETHDAKSFSATSRQALRLLKDKVARLARDPARELKLFIKYKLQR